jgi:hypothetical protein
MFVGCKAEITRASKSLVFTFAPMKCNYCDSEYPPEFEVPPKVRHLLGAFLWINTETLIKH